MDPQVRSLLLDAARWRLLSLLLHCPTPRWRDQIAALAPEVNDPALAAAARRALREAREGLYHSTFGPGGPAAPRESSYSESVELGHLMSELSAYYSAFAYQPDSPEPPDHVAVQLGFLAYLKLKEAYARAAGDAQNAEVAASAAARFLADHLAHLGRSLAESLKSSGVAYLARTASLLAARLPEVPLRSPVAPELLPVWQDGCE